MEKSMEKNISLVQDALEDYVGDWEEEDHPEKVWNAWDAIQRALEGK